MQTSKIDMWRMSNNDKFTPEQMQAICSKLEQADDNAVQTVIMLELKSPTVVLILSLFLGALGVDRFILGQTGLGILKIITISGLGVWGIIDWFTAMSRTKKYNFSKVADALPGLALYESRA